MEDPNNPRFQLSEAELLKGPMEIDESTKLKGITNTRRFVTLTAAASARSSLAALTLAAMANTTRSVEDFGRAMAKVSPQRKYVPEWGQPNRKERRAAYLRRTKPAPGSKLARMAAEHRLGLGHPR